MSISSIVQIAERLLNGNLGQDQGNQGKSKPAQRATQGQNNQTEFGDRFTRSADTADGNAAGETGILQVECTLTFTSSFRRLESTSRVSRSWWAILPSSRASR